MITVTIDPFAGFCPGVTKAITTADHLLEGYPSVYSFGELVHCPEETDRLESQGLKIMTSEEIDKVSNSVILIRAHGITPRTQFRLEISDNTVVDATCSIVHRLQQKVKTCSHEMKEVGGQVIIFGKRKHPEVEGLLGYSDGKAIVVEKADDLTGIDFNRPMSVFAQTTSNVSDYDAFILNITAKLDELGVNKESFQIYNTICGSIKVRVPRLKQFAKENDVVIMVSGAQSSNGIYLTSILNKENVRTYKISSEAELEKQWFTDAAKIGITGAASTPVWLLEKVATAIENMVNQ
ncbi:MAG TPA: 4-hydroxy-3-methylbut-2-enyl diphosphate reductase [Lentimicrobium sp.]|nr:4-hydroxy-3-methylbut-2-enyl diphosphate reductase [Lentimicrobium sp.]